MDTLFTTHSFAHLSTPELSDFQTNAPLMEYQMFTSPNPDRTRALTGLGITLGYEQRISTLEAPYMLPPGPTPSPCFSPVDAGSGSPFFAMPPSTFLSYQENFEYRRTNFLDEFPISRFSNRQEFYCDDSFSAGASPSLSGPVPDLNMYLEAYRSPDVCVRPQDLVGTFAPELVTQEAPMDVTPQDYAHQTPAMQQDLSLSAPESVPGVLCDVTNAATFTTRFQVEPQGVERASRVPRQRVQDDQQENNTSFPKGSASVTQASPSTPRTTLVEQENIDEVLVDVEIYDPHKGVSLDDVIQKISFFRAHRPGQRLPDDMISLFGGRLAANGNLIQEFRCYITGCGKLTRRKDHMSDHIRAHVGEKPYNCRTCGLSFIRSNDCRRHEFNHGSQKRFVCKCKAAFARKDLFVRHKNTTCFLYSISEERYSQGSSQKRRKMEHTGSSPYYQ